jgi:O-antigen ligase
MLLSNLYEIRYLLLLEILLLAVFAIFEVLPFLIFLGFVLFLPFLFLLYEKPVVLIHLLMISILAGAIGTIKISGKTPNILFVDIFFFILLSMLFIKTLLSLNKSIEIPILILIWIPFLVWSVLGVISAVEKFRVLVYWKNYFAGFVVFSYAWFVLKNKIHVKQILYAFIIWGVVLSLIELKIVFELGGIGMGIVGLFLKKNLLATSWGRSNYLAAFYVFIIPLSIALLFYFKSLKNRLFQVFALILMFTGIIITLSRGGIISLVFALIILFSKLLKTKTFIPLLIIFVIVSLVVFLNPLTQVLIERSAAFERSASVFTRINFYEDVWKTFLENPILGVGFGNLGFYSQFEIASAFSTSAHNIVLGMLGETGLVGAISFFAIFWLLIKKIIAEYRDENDNSLKLLRWAFIASLSGVLLHSFMEPNFEGIQFSIMFWLLFSVYFKLHLLKDEPAVKKEI